VKSPWIKLSDEEPSVDDTTDRTENILLTDGRSVVFAYGEVDRFDDLGLEWHQVGPDYYSVDFRPTHWMQVPELPR
jgi:hypothetical protein